MKNVCQRISELTEITETSDQVPRRGWIVYDADCQFCAASAKQFENIFRRRGFQFLPLQTPWIQKRLGLKAGAPLREMRVLAGGHDVGGGDAVIFLARQIWWVWPFYLTARLPGVYRLVDLAYRWIAAHRGCTHIACNLPRQQKWPGWIALIALPVVAFLSRRWLAPWQFMWVMVAGIFFGCKWLTFWRARNQAARPQLQRALGYFFLWPGMDAQKFLSEQPGSAIPATANLTALSNRVSQNLGELLFACAKVLFGAVLLFVVARLTNKSLLTGWTGMVGMIFILHFGLFQLAATGCRLAGVDVDPIMHAPWRSRSLGEFWSRRWNAPFNQLASDFVFRPFTHRVGVAWATLVTFLISGLIHELVISLPARGAYGLPTAYFLLQGCGILAERWLPEIRGRTFTILVTTVPAFWLFHPPFVRQVILPFMHAIHAL